VRLVSFRTAANHAGFGPINGDGVVDAGRRLPQPSASLRAALAAGHLDAIRAMATAAPDHALADVQLLPPIPQPGKLIMIGLNYRSHQQELGAPEPKNPMVIARFANSQIGHGETIIRPSVSEQLDYEGELAVVIGRRARRLSAENALTAVLGYACYMDGTVRDFMGHTSQLTPAKSFPGTGGVGPWIVTADEIADPDRLDLMTRINGEVVQQASTADMIWGVRQLVAYLSTFVELEAGDVICTGTPSGVGWTRKPPRWLRPGDGVEVEIAGIGVLANPVAAEG
jgi:2-keto-4-pentenoate hydratase/2-oxohepta-3-ene-1,7-dioic acid hydratase in catechol pathway